MWCLITALLACAPAVQPSPGPAEPVQSDSVRDFLTLVPHVVNAVPPALLRDRPLLVDLRSFVLAGNSITGQELDSTAVAAAIGREFLNVRTDAAVTHPSEYRYEVRDDGVHLRLDGVSRIGRQYRALVTYLYTERRGEQAAIGATQILLTFTKMSDGWKLEGRTVLGTS